MPSEHYIGRFAPSPTGLLHIGSLLTALASYADAKAHNGKWLVRIEDLDPPREMAGASSHILHTLEAFGFEWDGEVIFQSQRHHLYAEALETLKQQQHIYPCFCSRKEWQAQAKAGIDGFVYNGHCRNLMPSETQNHPKTPAWRMRVNDQIITLNDRIVGTYQQNLAHDIGDFTLLRADKRWAYQLAVVVDDAEQRITHIVRGQDLLVSTPRQIWLQQCLNLPTVHYAHLPLLVNRHGQKWSKQTRATALDVHQREKQLRQVMTYLNIPSAPDYISLQELIKWTILHWNIKNVNNLAICTE